MDRERWEHLERLYHAALARSAEERAAFLTEACAGDERLRRDLESLLARATSEGILASPVAVLAGLADPDATVHHHEIRSGTMVGPYRIDRLLGRGGMGEVYRAHDTKLGRDVAIKVLPPAFALDRDRLSRFEREARVLAALNHPNIAAIYGFEQAGDIRGLVLELVEGPTLAERVAGSAGSAGTPRAEPGPRTDVGRVPRREGEHARRGPAGLGLPIDEALTIAIQIADALETAHAKGIVHRDLKPANVKLRPDGVVKVLDFGLAKVWTDDRAEADLSQAPTVTATGTREGALLGTAAYMSPEQARGKRVDMRTDVWAFGCVLFEMLSGRAAFAGETFSDTLARILEREPAWRTLPRATPARVRDLLRRCLDKDLGKRLPDLIEARRALEASLASPFRMPRAVLESLRWRASRPMARALAILAIVAASVTIYELRDREAPIPQLSNPVQVTNAIGVEDHPTWSPDGRTLAYESNETGNWDVWLTQVGGGAAVNRTADHPGDDRYVSWSPDGRQIAFWSDRDGGGYYIMPALGGVPTRVLPTAGRAQTFHSPPAWSADGASLACATYTTSEGRSQAFVEIVSLVTRDTRRAQLPGIEEARLDLTWSADGRYLAYVDAAQQPSETTQLWVLRLSDGHATTLAGGRSNIRRPKWSPDGRYLYYVSNRVGPPDLWRQRIAEDGSAVGDPERVTTGLEVRGAAFSADGTKVAYSKGRWVSNIWRVPILENRPATWADAMQMTFEQAFIEFLSVSRDGRLLAYSSDRAGNQDLWLLPIGGEARQMTADPAPDWNPLLSPNGQQIAFYSYRTGDREIFVMPSTGGAATQLTRSRGLDVASSWSPDGRQLVFRSERTGDSEIWVMAADGTGLRQITNHPAGDYNPSWSPDGQWLAFISTRGGQIQILRVSPAGGEPELLIPAAGLTLLWSANGEDIYFAPDGRNFRAFSLTNRRTRPLTDLAGRRGTLGSQQLPATDGAFLYFTWRDDLGDIWVMDVAAR